MAKDSVLEYKDLIGDDGTFEELSENIKGLKAELLDLAKTMKKTFSSLKPDDTAGIGKAEKELKDLEKTQKNLVKTEKAMQKAKKKSIELTNEELIQREKQKRVNRERIQIAKQQAIIQDKESGQIEKLRAKLSLTTLQWKKLSKEELNNTKKGKALITTKLKLTNTLKKLEKQTGDNRREVGNYGKSLGKVGKIAAKVFVGRSIIDGLRRIGGAFSQLIQDGKDSNATLARLDKGFSRAGNALTNVGGKLLEVFTPIILFIVEGFVSILEFITGANLGVEEFTATSEELKGVTDGLTKEFAKESAELSILFTQLDKTNEGSKERKDLIDKINTAYGKYLPNLLTEKSTLKDIASAQQLANEALTQSFLLKIQQATLEDIVTNKVKAQIESFSDLEGRAKGAISGNVAQFNRLISSLDNTQSAASRAFSSIRGGKFDFDRLNSAVAESDPKLAKFLRSIKDLDDQTQKTLIEKIKRAARVSGNFDDAINDANKSINDIASGIITYDHAITSSTKSTDKSTTAIKANLTARLKAIEAVQKQVEKLEGQGIEDKQLRLIELEKQRFKAEQDAQEVQNEIDKKLLAGHEDELRALKLFNYNRAELQERVHQENLLKIRKDFAIKSIDIISIDVLKDAQEDEAALLNEKVELVDEANKKILKSNEDLLKGIQSSANKIGNVIVDLFKKQADLSAESVNKQEENLSRARDRAAKGLESNLAFEEQELAKRQLEQQRRQKEAEQAARILTLFNLVSAYAAGGDKNALARGLVDFSLLTALSAGFEEGGYTGDNGTKEVAGVVHGKEFVVTAKDTARFGLAGKTGGEFGEAMGDYFDPQSPIQQNPYSAQKEAFKQDVKTTTTGSNEMVRELKAIKSQLAKQPNVGIEIEKMYENVYAMIKSESKQTVTKISRKFLRSK